MLTERTVSGLHAHLFELLCSHVEMSPRMRVLDIGCGTGAWLKRLSALGITSLVGLDYVQPQPVIGLDLRHFDINADDPATLGKHDVVTCIEVIEHIENIGKLLDLVEQSMGVNGIAVITTPNVESLRARVRALFTGKLPSFDNKGDPTHLFPVLYESLQKMLARRGLKVMSVHQYPEDVFESRMYGKAVNRASHVMRLVLPDAMYGDNVIYYIKRN